MPSKKSSAGLPAVVRKAVWHSCKLFGKYDDPTVSVGDWFQDSLETLKSAVPESLI